VKHALRTKSVGTKASEAELRVLESRAAAAGLTLSAWVRDVLLGSSVEMGAMAAERAILAEMLAMRAIILNFILKLRRLGSPGTRPIRRFPLFVTLQKLYATPAKRPSPQSTLLSSAFLP
jgi:mobilization protein NikA